jgi:hypothetical protein
MKCSKEPLESTLLPVKVHSKPHQQKLRAAGTPQVPIPQRPMKCAPELLSDWQDAS